MRKPGSLQVKFRMVAWMVLYVPMLWVAAVALLAKAWLVGDDRFEVVGIVAAVVAVIALLVLLVQAAKVRCPVCIGRVFGSAGCSKHREAKRFLGSTRLGTVMQTIVAFKGVKCRFCGTCLHLDAEDLELPDRNVIDEFHALQGRSGRRSRLPTRSVNAGVPAVKGPGRHREKRGKVTAFR